MKKFLFGALLLLPLVVLSSCGQQCAVGTYYSNGICVSSYATGYTGYTGNGYTGYPGTVSGVGGCPAGYTYTGYGCVPMTGYVH